MIAPTFKATAPKSGINMSVGAIFFCVISCYIQGDSCIGELVFLGWVKYFFYLRLL